MGPCVTAVAEKHPCWIYIHFKVPEARSFLWFFNILRYTVYLDQYFSTFFQSLTFFFIIYDSYIKINLMRLIKKKEHLKT